MNGVYEFVKVGGDIEIVDGDNKKMNAKCLKRVVEKFQGLGEPFFTVAILGPQSTGKSTLLNFLFNTCFKVSAGRCTNGLYASFLPTNYELAKRCMILDTEGLLSIERGDSDFDKQMTILTMSISQVMIMNVNG